MNLVKDAFVALAERVSLESIESTPAGVITETRAITPAAKEAIDAKKLEGVAQATVNGVQVGQEPKFAMNGPLSTIFARALNITFAKVDPATGEVTALKDTHPSTNTGVPASVGNESVALETQSNDWVRAAMALKEKEGAYPTDGSASGNIKPGVDEHKPQDDSTTIATSTTGVRAIELRPDEIIPIFKKPEGDDVSYNSFSDVVFYTDSTSPTDSTPMGEGRRSLGMIQVGDHWNTTIESISVLVKLKDMPPDDLVAPK